MYCESFQWHAYSTHLPPAYEDSKIKNHVCKNLFIRGGGEPGDEARPSQHFPDAENSNDLSILIRADNRWTN